MRRKKIERARKPHAPAGQAVLSGRAARTILLGVLIAGGGFMGARKAIAWVQSCDTFKLENIKVSGVMLLDTADVLARANIAAGTHLANLDAGAIAKRLKNSATVQGVSIRRRLPNTVDILVRERQPVAMINAGQILLADKEGVLIDLPAGRYLDVPVISGLNDSVCGDAQRCLTGESTRRMNAFLDRAHAARPDIARRITQIAFCPGSRVKFWLETGPTMIEIDETQVEKRMEHLGRLMKAQQANSESWPRRISLCYANVAYVRR